MKFEEKPPGENSLSCLSKTEVSCDGQTDALDGLPASLSRLLIRKSDSFAYHIKREGFLKAKEKPPPQRSPFPFL